jgi:hypothetical protein
MFQENVSYLIFQKYFRIVLNLFKAPNCLFFKELNQLTGVAAILNYPLPDIEEEEEEENEQETVVETT